jgi:RNA polymerase sigma-70 factor (ECF subfamily)
VASDRAAVDTSPDPEGAVIAAESRETLLRAIRTLRDDDREVLGARFFLELSEGEAAEALGIPRGTVKSRTARALGRLRDALGEIEPEEPGR